MSITTEALQRFVGGQLEIQNGGEGYLFRGEIGEIGVEGEDLNVKFAWLATWDTGTSPMGMPNPDGKWVNDEQLDYAIGLAMFGPPVEDDERLILSPMIPHETLVFFQPGGSKLDPEKVEGLQLQNS